MFESHYKVIITHLIVKALIYFSRTIIQQLNAHFFSHIFVVLVKPTFFASQ